MKYKVLIIEDEPGIRGFLKINFQKNNYIVIEAKTGEEGINKALTEKPHIILLDIMLPGLDGFEVCKRIRKSDNDVGIIILTARTQEHDRIHGLEIGCDDYVTKPFNPKELILRVKGVIRRIYNNEDEIKKITINSGEFTIDLYSQKLFKSGKEIEVTPKEYMIIKLFMENENRAFSRDEILNTIWGYNFVGEPKIVDVNIRRLRVKVEENGSRKYIETIWGTGYRWRKQVDAI